MAAASAELDPAGIADSVLDVAVVGAGLVGLATAMALLNERPGLRLAVLEKEPSIASHQSGHVGGADLVAAFRAEERPLGSIPGSRWSGGPGTHRSQPAATDLVRSSKVAFRRRRFRTTGASPKRSSCRKACGMTKALVRDRLASALSREDRRAAVPECPGRKADAESPRRPRSPRAPGRSPHRTA